MGSISFLEINSEIPLLKNSSAKQKIKEERGSPCRTPQLEVK